MDGLDNDADVAFVLKTNRVDMLLAKAVDDLMADGEALTRSLLGSGNGSDGDGGGFGGPPPRPPGLAGPFPDGPVFGGPAAFSPGS
jgi:hypothetical protein